MSYCPNAEENILRVSEGILKRCENALEFKKWCDGEKDCLSAETDLHMEIRLNNSVQLLSTYGVIFE